MNKYIKYGLIGVAALAGLFALLLLVIALTVKPNDYKPQIVRLVKEKTQRTLTLDGDIKLALFPKLGLDLGKATLSVRDGTAEFAGVRGLRLYVAWLPLLQKRLVVDRIGLDGARAHLVRNRDGTTNFDDLLGTEKESEPGALKFDVEGVKVSDAALTFDDRQAGRKIAVSGLTLSTGRLKEGTPTTVEGEFDLQADKPALMLHARLKSGLMFDPVQKHYVLEGADMEAKGEAAGISGLVASARGDLDVQGGEFSARDLKFAVSGQRGADHLELKLDAPKMQLTKARASGERLTLEARIEQPKGGAHAVLTVPGLEGTGEAFKAGEVTLVFDGKQGDNSLKGKLTTLLAGSLQAQRLDFDQLQGDLELAGAALPKGAVRVSLKGDAHADLKNHKTALNLAIRLDESNITARLGMTGFASPRYSFDVGIDRLDVDRYFPPKPKQKAQGPEKPFDLSALKTLKATGRLRIGSLKFSNVKASNVRLDLKAADGKLELSPVSANLYQGALAGSLSVDAAALPKVALRQRLTGVSIGPLLKDVTDKDVMEGRGNASLDVAAQGATVGAMKKSLRGGASAILRDGAVKGINLAGALRSAKARLGTLKGEQVQGANPQEKTDFSELKASFVIRHGVAHNDDLYAKSPLLRVTGNGDIDIGASTIDYLAKATVVASLQGQGGPELAAMRGVTVPVRISGPFDALRYKLDFNAMASEMVKQKVEQKKEEVKGKVEEKLREQLKGLFGR